MSKTLIAEAGDCLINLSRREGFSWKTIWNHPQNAALRERRQHLNIIKKGDQVFIPDFTTAEFARPTDQLHKFVVEGLTTRFTLTLLDLGKPRAKERYVLTVNGISRQGLTDKNGMLSEPIPPTAQVGTLLVGDNQEEFTIDFGYIDPIGEISGVKTRLQNLGFYEGEIDDEITPELSSAIAEFHRSVNLPGEGELTDATRNALVQSHGS
jgi:Putative peptidoglycan binding domain